MITYRLTITILSPLHIGSGNSLTANVDYYVDGETTYVVDSDAVLELVARHWREDREPFEETLRRHEAELEREEQAILQADARLKERAATFDANPPRNREERQRQEDRLRQEFRQIKERRQRLAERRAVPPAPSFSDELPDELLRGSTLDQLVAAKLLPIEQLRAGATVDGRALVFSRFNSIPVGANAIIEQIKDVFGKAYIPGSSLKGALRTALLETALLARAEAPDWRKLGERDKFAAQELERDITGRGERPSQAPNYDIFRTIRIGDSTPGEQAWLALSNVAVWPAGQQGIPLNVETITPGSIFTCDLTIDDYLFSRHAAKLNFAPRRALIDGMATACRTHAEARITYERTFLNERGATQPAQFYEGLSSRLSRLPENAWLMQVGWGAGWESKTIARTLRRHNQVGALVRRYRLDRGKGHGGAFPATRHLVVDERRMPREPLGWVEVRMER